MTLISLTTLKQFPKFLRTEWKERSLEIYAINGDEIRTWGPASVSKTRRVFLNSGGVIEPRTGTTLQGKVSENLNENMEDWLEEHKSININKFGCLFATRVAVFVEEVSNITNTEMDDKGNKMNKGCFELINEILKLSEVSLPEILKQHVITKKKRIELLMFESLKAKRK